MENSEYELGLYVSRRTNMTKRKRPENQKQQRMPTPAMLSRKRTLADV